MNKSIYIFIALTAIFGVFQSTHASNISQSCNSNELDSYQLYECRKKSVCDVRKPQNMIFNTDKDDTRYLKLEPKNTDFLSENQRKYRENMNNLYKCALIQVQLNAVSYTESKMKNADEDVRKKIQPKLAQRKQKLEAQKSICVNSDDTSIYNKANVLLQASYEVCKYLNYLDYLDTYSNTLSNTVTESSSATQIAANQIRIKQAITDEQNHIIRVFPLAYTAYSQYESNITIHFMLELVREDFIIFRNRLHKVLGPISQLLYKANNSQKQH